MELLLKSQKSDERYTKGELFIDGVHECFVLEDVAREVPGKQVSEWKVKKKTAIPSGRYEVKMTMSSRFKRIMIQIMDVPGFEGIRMHSGNTEEDTDGCPIVGDTFTPFGIAGGKAHGVLDRLEKKVQAAIDKGDKVFITVERMLS